MRCTHGLRAPCCWRRARAPRLGGRRGRPCWQGEAPRKGKRLPPTRSVCAAEVATQAHAFPTPQKASPEWNFVSATETLFKERGVASRQLGCAARACPFAATRVADTTTQAGLARLAAVLCVYSSRRRAHLACTSLVGVHPHAAAPAQSSMRWQCTRARNSGASRVEGVRKENRG